jgi:hypothetical protein
MLLPLHALPVGHSGTVELLVLEGSDAKTISGLGIVLGSQIESVEGGFSFDDKSLMITPELSSQILIRTL